MENQNEFSIEELLDKILRRKCLIIIPFILAAIITPIVYTMLPKIYRAETLILVIPQNIPEEFIRSTISSSVKVRLDTLTDEVLSRTRLEKIIKDFNLYHDNKEKLPMDVIVDLVRKDVGIDVSFPKSSRAVDQSSSIRLSFQGKDPETIKNVTNRLSSLFIEENLKTRAQQAAITTDFLNNELASAKEELVKQEKAISEYKFEKLNILPQQQATNLAMLEQLAEQRKDLNERLYRVEDNMVLIRRHLSERSQEINQERNQFSTDIGQSSIQTQLQAAKEMLSTLMGTYTSNHIVIRKAQSQIKQLEERLESEQEENDPNKKQTRSPIEDQVIKDLKNQLMISEREIKRLKEEEAKVKEQIAIYEKRLEEVPQVEVELSALTRNYENTKQFYEELLGKKMAAEQAENLEKRQQGEQFKVLDPAVLPRIPFKPNPKKVLPVGILLGLGLGCGLAFLAEMMDKSFKNVKDAEKYLNESVLAVIPVVKNEQSLYLRNHS